jgi:hypothetical protein
VENIISRAEIYKKFLQPAALGPNTRSVQIFNLKKFYLGVVTAKNYKLKFLFIAFEMN